MRCGRDRTRRGRERRFPGTASTMTFPRATVSGPTKRAGLPARGKGMSHRTALTISERPAPGRRERHIRRVMDAAQDSYSASTRRNYAGAWRQFVQWAGREGFSALPAKPETVAAYPGRTGRRRAVTRIALHGPRRDPPPSQRSRTGESGRQRRRPAGDARAHPPAGVRGPHPEAGRRSHGQGAGGDPRDRQPAPHRTGRSNRGGAHGPPPWARGRGAHLGHAGRHAPSKRIGKAAKAAAAGRPLLGALAADRDGEGLGGLRCRSRRRPTRRTLGLAPDALPLCPPLQHLGASPSAPTNQLSSRIK